MDKAYKKFILGVAILIAVTALVACGKTNKGDEKDNSELTITCAEVLDDMMELDSKLPELMIYDKGIDNGEDVFHAFSNESMDLVSDYAYAYAADGSAPELIVLKLKNIDDAEKIMSDLKEHMELREGTMANYSPEEVEMVKNGKIVREGVYIGMFIGNKSTLMQSSFTEILE